MGRVVSRSLRQWAAAGSFVGLFAACTAVRDHRHTLDWLDATLTPTSPTARGLLLPVAIPVGCVGLLADVLLVNPVLAIDDAWGDTTDLLWTSQEESVLRRVLFTPIAAVATPFVFAGDWLGRSLLPLEPRREAP